MPLVTFSRCGGCGRRWWLVDGADASFAEVQIAMHLQPPRRTVPRAAAELRERQREAGPTAPVIPLHRRRPRPAGE